MLNRRPSRAVAGLLAAVLGLAGCTAGSGAPGHARASHRSPPAAGWLLTVYYTAVERYHSGPAVTVTGCRQLDCAHGDADLGRFRADFVRSVRDEGTGRTLAGDYLNWSYDTGYWLDVAPRDTAGRPLAPFTSAAADPGVLPAGTAFAVQDCGRADGRDSPPPDVCAGLRAGTWRITDEFTPGLGGPWHVDLYLGEQTGPDFTAGPWYTTLHGATLRIA